MKLRLGFALCVVLLVAATACSLTSLIPGAGSSATASALWTDVPPLDGATRDNIEMPLPVRLAMQAVLQGQVEFIIYSTPKTPQEIKDFYTKERMQAAGWDANSSAGCESNTNQSQSQSGMQDMCFFSKTEGTKEVGLVILMVQDDKTKNTQLFYARVSAEQTPVPGTPSGATPTQ